MPDPDQATEEVVDESPDTAEVIEEQPDEPAEDDTGALKRAYERVKAERKAERDLWDNEEALEAKLREKYPGWFASTEDDVLDDDDDDDGPDEPRDDPRVAFVYQREIQRQIDEDLSTFVRQAGEDRELHGGAREWVIARAQQDPKGFSPNALKKAVDDWFALVDGLGPAKPKPKPKSHQPPRSGGPATEVPDLDDRDARRRYMADEWRRRSA